MRNKPKTQVYEQYTTEDFTVWKTLYERQMSVLSGKLSSDYEQALKDIQFSPDKIPHFAETNELLRSITGWELITVPCISEVEEFFSLLAAKKFTATCWLRSLSELDYLEEPDMFHDVFGHAPLLTNPDYCAFFHAIGEIAMQNINRPLVLKALQHIYWYTIEFGLIEERGICKAYGAGIISSPGEAQFALSEESQKIAFDLREMINRDFRTDVIQDKYFVIQSFKQLKDAIPEIERAALQAELIHS